MHFLNLSQFLIFPQFFNEMKNNEEESFLSSVNAGFTHFTMVYSLYLFKAVCCPLPLAKDEDLRKKCLEVPLCLMMSSSWLRLGEVEEDMAREEMDTLAVEGKIQLTASNFPGMGLWMTGSMWEALMEGMEVIRDRWNLNLSQAGESLATLREPALA